jgi:hypothetical protein
VVHGGQFPVLVPPGRWRRVLPVARSTGVHRRSRLVPPGGCDLLVGEALLAAVTPAGRPAVTRWQLATELVADVGQLEQRIAAGQAHSKTAVAQANPSLLELSGSGVPLHSRSGRWAVHGLAKSSLDSTLDRE